MPGEGAAGEGHDRALRDTNLLIVADGARVATAVSTWLGERARAGSVERVTGFYAAVTALGARVPIIVMDASVSAPRDEWQLAGLRPYCEVTTVIVVAEEPRRSALAGALHADLAVSNISQLPPLRELMTGPTTPVETGELAPPASTDPF